MIRIEYDDKSNPNYVNTKWIEESETHSAMLRRLQMPVGMFNKMKEEYKDWIDFIEKQI